MTGHNTMAELARDTRQNRTFTPDGCRCINIRSVSRALERTGGCQLRQACLITACGPVDLDLIVNWRVTRTGEIGRGFAASGGVRQALAPLGPGGPARIVGTYSSIWMRPSKVRLLIISSATSG